MADTLSNMREKVDPKLLRDKLSAWEGKTSPLAPLTEKQRDTIMELTTLSSSRPLPIEVRLKTGQF